MSKQGLWDETKYCKAWVNDLNKIAGFTWPELHATATTRAAAPQGGVESNTKLGKKATGGGAAAADAAEARLDTSIHPCHLRGHFYFTV